MNITHIRNATLIVEYANRRFLIDPMLGEKGTFPPFPNSPREDQYNPLVELPISVEDVLSDIDAVILTHLHPDHFDEAAKEIIPKDIHIYTQNEEDAETVRNDNFTNVTALDRENTIGNITLIKTPGEHGRGEVLKIAGEVCGLIFKHSQEETLYVAGDTVWYDEVEKTLNTHQPEVIVVNGGDNQFNEGGSLVMGKEDILNVAKTMPTSKIISVHMEAVNHWTLSREELSQFATEQGISPQILIPEDGEKYSFN